MDGPTGALPGQVDEPQGECYGNQAGAHHQASEESPLAVTIDIPLQDLVSLPAFGNIQLQGTRVSGFNKEATPVLKALYGKEIIKIGDNMRVGSAKDIFIILEEYSKLGEDTNALVRFHCRAFGMDPTESEVYKKVQIAQNTLAPDVKKQSRGSILRQQTTNTEIGKSTERSVPILDEAVSDTERRSNKEPTGRKTVGFNQGDSVVAVEAFLADDMHHYPAYGVCLQFLNRHFTSIAAILMIGLLFVLIFLMIQQSPDRRALQELVTQLEGPPDYSTTSTSSAIANSNYDETNYKNLLFSSSNNININKLSPTGTTSILSTKVKDDHIVSSEVVLEQYKNDPATASVAGAKNYNMIVGGDSRQHDIMSNHVGTSKSSTAGAEGGIT